MIIGGLRKFVIYRLSFPINFMAKKQETFENSLKELEKIVRKLEDGDLALEESLKLFENGVKLSRECRERLDQAERRIEILLEDEQGNPALQAIEKEDLLEEKPKVKRRIVFDDNDDFEDESPF